MGFYLSLATKRFCDWLNWEVKKAKMAVVDARDEEAPLVVDNLRHTSKNHTRDIHILSSAFLLVFLAFGAAQNLETTVNTVSCFVHGVCWIAIGDFNSLLLNCNWRLWFLLIKKYGIFLIELFLLVCTSEFGFCLQEQGLGTISLGILYLSFTFFSTVASLVVRFLGSRNAMILGTTGYWFFIAANLLPTW